MLKSEYLSQQHPLMLGTFFVISTFSIINLTLQKCEMEKISTFTVVRSAVRRRRRNDAEFGVEIREALVWLSFFFFDKKNKNYDFYLNRLMHPMVCKQRTLDVFLGIKLGNSDLNLFNKGIRFKVLDTEFNFF